MAESGDGEYAFVPVHTDKLAMLSDDVDTLLEVRWARRELEHRWATEAVAEQPNPDDDSPNANERQLALARQLCCDMVQTEFFFEPMLRIMGDRLREAVERRRRPHPGTAAWWDRRGRGELRYTRFVQVSWEELACAQELIVDAYEPAQQLTMFAEDLDRDCDLESAAAANAAVVHSTPRLLERQRHAQRLNDAILIPLYQLRRLLDDLIGTNEPRRHGKRGRARSATPSRASAASTRSMIRRRSI